MFVLDSVSCTDNFPADGASGGAQIVAQAGSNGGYASVATNDVYVQLAFDPDGSGSLQWTPAVHVGPGNIILEKGTRGIRFKNYTPGAVAVVSAGLSEPSEPALQLTAGGVSVPVTSTGAMVLLYDSVDSAVVLPAATITVPSLPQTYAHLRVVIAAVGSQNSEVQLQFNASAAANYYISQVQAGLAGGITQANRITQTVAYFGNLGVFESGGTIDIPNYCVQTGGGGKVFTSSWSGILALTANQQLMQTTAGLWQVNQAISSIVFSLAAGTFQAGTRVSVYGITG